MLLNPDNRPLEPFVTAESIQDRSKADKFTKPFACGQSGWLVVQCIARVSAGLPITELELATAGFVLCALVMYVMRWDKPFDVEHRTIIPFDVPKGFPRGFQPEHWIRQLSSPSAASTYRVSEIERNSLFDLLGVKFGFSSFPVVTYGTATVFSAIHVAAWNWTFRSPTIRILWRVFSVAATGSPLFSLLASVVYGSIPPSSHSVMRGSINKRIVFGSVIFGVVVYFISHVGLLVLIFYSFCSMPEGVYETIKWMNYFPHFS